MLPAIRILRQISKSYCISLNTLCLVTSSYFVQDGIIRLIDSLFGLVQAYPSQNTIWKLLDGIVLLVLGYMCVLGLENGRLNLIRWPTLLLFIYKVIDYFLQHLHRQLKSQSAQLIIDRRNLLAQEYLEFIERPVEWTTHFLIPSIHIVSVTFFLWKYVHSSPFAVRFTKTCMKPIERRICGNANDQIRLLDLVNDDE